MAKKAYEGKVLLEAGRFSVLAGELDTATRSAACTRIDALVAENPEYCDEGNYDHLCNLLSAIALVETLQETGASKEDALDRVAQAMWDYVENGTAQTYRKVFGKPGMLWLLGKLLPALFAKGSGYGWSYVWHTDEATGKRLQFECTSCIYAQLLAKYGLPELGPIFCRCDDINYGHIPSLEFRREHTLCTDGEPCDFLFVKE